MKTNNRILIVDDNRAIHEDIRKIITTTRTRASLSDIESELFGDAPAYVEEFELSSAYQGEEGAAMVARARALGEPYALAIVDMRMPPGWDGLETIAAMWKADPELQVVICTAYSDASWGEIRQRLGRTDQLLILKKPFEISEVLQLACALTEKWDLARRAQTRVVELDRLVEEQTRKLSKSLALAYEVQEAVIDGILAIDTDRNVVAVNQRFGEMWRIPAARLAAASAEELVDHIVDEVADPAQFLERIAHLDTHTHEQSEDETHLKDGRIFERWSSPIHSSAGEHCGRLWCFRDVTERRKLEGERAVLTERMASMGRLAASVGHEINNPLAYAMVNVSLVQDLVDCHKDSSGTLPVGEVLEGLATTSDGLARIRVIVSDLQTLSRPDDETACTVDLEQVLEQSIKIAATQLHHRARVVRRYGGDEKVWVVGNSTRLGQAFLNLIVNAAQAIPEGRIKDNTVTIAVVTGDTMAVVEVTDTGVGIPANQLEQIFDPFYTTKAVGSGTGLGLSICRGIIAGYGGTITVRSQLGVGTTFAVALRRTEIAEVGPVVVAPSLVAVPRRGRVLVVDDEDSFGRVLVRILKARADVVVTTAAREALELIEGDGPFDLILCDLMMPDVCGMDLHELVLRDNPAVAARMVFMTGGAFTPRAEAFLANVPNPMLRKPFKMLELDALLDAALGPTASE